jgi:hypothetical protein
MSIVLALYKGASWVAVLPYALTISAVLVALGAVLDWLARRRSAPSLDRDLDTGTGFRCCGRRCR